MIRKTTLLLLSALLLPAAASFPARAGEPGGATSGPATLSGKLAGELRVSGEVRVTDDVTVLPGARLLATPGTVFVFETNDSTKVDPEQFHGGIEMVVRGTLSADNAVFRFSGRAGGIVVDGGRAQLSGAGISGAEAGLTVLRGGEAAAARGLRISDCRVGVAIFPGGRLDSPAGSAVRLAGNGVGLALFPGAGASPAGVAFENSEEADTIAWPGDAAAGAPAEPFLMPVPASGAARMGDTFVDRDTTLSGDIVVDGTIRVSPGTTLTIEPGSRLFFTFRDTDDDGIGENGLFLQGNLHARGTPGRPIGFYPAAGDSRGLWDSINFMASDEGENVLEHIEVAGAYRGLHAHFSKVAVSGLRIVRCFRGLQFQESEVSLSGVSVRECLSVLRGRDATVRIDGLSVRGVVSGVNLFRSAVTLGRIDMADTGFYGARLRDSRVSLDEGRFSQALVPLSVQEGTARFADVSASEPGLSGFSLLDGDVTMDRYRSTGSRVDGISAVRGRLVMTGGELSGYVRDAVHLSGPAEVTLKGTKLGSPRGAKNIPVHDGKVVPGLGIVRVE